MMCQPIRDRGPALPATCHRAGPFRATTGNTGAMDPDAALDLLKEILAGVPRLPGAACIGKHHMFDPVLGNGHQYRDQDRARLTETARA